MIKLCVFDIDGVLRGTDGVPPETLQVLRTLQKNGVHCTVATGRGFLMAKWLLDGFSPNAPLVVENGGRIVQPEGDDISFHPIGEEIVQACAPIMDQETLLWGTFVERDGGKYRFLASKSEGRQKIAEWPQEVVAGITEDPSVFLDWAISANPAKMAFRARPGDTLQVSPEVPHTFNTGSYDIGPEGINKGTGLEELSQFLGIPMENILLAGDDQNDIPLFLSDARVKIAVGNQCPDILRERASQWIEGPKDLARALKEYFPDLGVGQKF